MKFRKLEVEPVKTEVVVLAGRCTLLSRKYEYQNQTVENARKNLASNAVRFMLAEHSVSSICEMVSCCAKGNGNLVASHGSRHLPTMVAIRKQRTLIQTDLPQGHVTYKRVGDR